MIWSPVRVVTEGFSEILTPEITLSFFCPEELNSKAPQFRVRISRAIDDAIDILMSEYTAVAVFMLLTCTTSFTC